MSKTVESTVVTDENAVEETPKKKFFTDKKKLALTVAAVAGTVTVVAAVFVKMKNGNSWENLVDEIAKTDELRDALTD